MTTSYKLTWDKEWEILRVGFGEPSNNDQIVKDTHAECQAIKNEIMGSRLLKINGKASLQAIAVIAHFFAHLVQAIAIYDPKLGSYVVSISHSPNYHLGQLVKDSEPIIV